MHFPFSCCSISRRKGSIQIWSLVLITKQPSVFYLCCCLLQVASGYTIMEKQCECQVMSFPATTDQCHWIAVAGTNSIVRYGLGSCGRYEGVVVSFLNFVVKGLANIDVTNCPIFSLLETVNGPVIGLTPLEFQTVCA